MPKKPAEPAPVEFWESPLEPVYHNIRKNLKGHPHANFIEIYFGLAVIVVFLLLTSLAPYIGEKLGLIFQRKEGQQSFASQEENDIKVLTDDLLTEYSKYQALEVNSEIKTEEPQIQPESPQPETTQSAQPEATQNAQPQLQVPTEQNSTATSASQVQGEKTQKDKKETKEDIENRMLEISQKRKEKLLALMQKDPDKVFDYKIPKEVRDKLPQNIQANIEEEVDLTGAVEVLHEDDFDNKKSKNLYFLNRDKEQYSLHNADTWPELISGSKIRVKGLRLDTKIAFNMRDTLEVLEAVQEGGAETTGEQRLAVILNDNTSLSKQAAEQFFFGDTGSVKDWFREVSYGRVNLSGNVFGPYNFSNTNESMKQIIPIVDPDIDFRNYDRIVLIPMTTNGSSVGKTLISTAEGELMLSVSWIGTSSIDLAKSSAGHELGHAFGLFHSNDLYCGSVTVGSAGCTTPEYGDLFDTMGGGKTYHYNAYQKDKLGWLNSQDIIQVTSSGMYTIMPFEESSTNPKVLKIPINASIPRAYGSQIYVEFRQPIGFDSNFGNAGRKRREEANVYNGALLHLERRLLDANPVFRDPSDPFVIPRSDGVIDSALEVGQEFFDPDGGIKITLIEKSIGGLKLDVNIGQPVCRRIDPSLWVRPLIESGEKGDSVGYIVNLWNNDSRACGPTNFTLNADTPIDWSSNFSINPLFLHPGGINSSTVSVVSALNTGQDTYFNISVSARRDDGGSLVSRSVNYLYLTDSPSPPRITTPILPSTLNPFYAYEEEEILFFVEATDPNSDILILNGYLSDGSEVGSIGVNLKPSNTQGKWIFSWFPNKNSVTLQEGFKKIPITFRASDGTFETSEEVIIELRNIDDTLTPPCGSYGDIDDSGSVTQEDADFVLQYVVGLITLTQDQQKRADVDGNRTIESTDALLITQYLQGSRDSFPMCSDTDRDGFVDGLETYIGTDPFRACPATSAINDESVDAWPPDFNDNGIVQIDDVNFVSSRFNAKEGDANYTKRAELATQNGVIGIDDINAATSRFNQSCSS